jgi:hypothetical protein|tara:strand:+ start:1851 stop:2207 length:357 start_codon:yes stop_codon:yes gene_type:complete
MATRKDAKVALVMGEFKRGTLKSSSGKKVTNRKQALAIANSEGDKAMRKKIKKMATGGRAKKQGFTDKLDESLGARNRKTKGNLGARRRESAGMEKKMGRRKYAAVKTMDKGRRKRKA